MNSLLARLMRDSGSHKYISAECQARVEYVALLVAEECAKMCMAQADKRNIRHAFGLTVESNVQYPGPEADNSINSQYNRQYNIPPQS
jgi:hypothetical protein